MTTDMKGYMRSSSERGIALVVTMMLMLLMSALLVGFSTIVRSDLRYRGIDRDRNQAFYAAHSGLEKMTVDLGNLFFINVAPTAAQLAALEENPPVIEGIAFETATGDSGYVLRASAPASSTIQSGPYQGLVALKTRYDMDSTARTSVGGEVHLTRSLETVAIPVFQFGMFSDVDLSFHAGAGFNFGGRVHTNGNLFLAQNTGTTLTLSDKVTALKEVIRKRLANGTVTATDGRLGPVRIATAPGACTPLSASCRPLAPDSASATNESSVADSVGSALNDPVWTGISLSTYNGYIRNGRTGAKALNLPLLTAGGTNPDIVKRPAVNEDVSNSTLFGARFFSQASLRILLSDTAADILNLPSVTPTQPVPLDWSAGIPGGYNNGAGIDAQHPPLAQSAGNGILTSTTSTNATVAGAVEIRVVTTANFPTPVPGVIWVAGQPVYCATMTATRFQTCVGMPATAAGTVVETGQLTPVNTPLLDGFLKIERQDQGGAWTDVTWEILNYGIASGNLANPACGDPNPNAILRLQRLRSRPGGAVPATCDNNSTVNPATTSTVSTHYTPQVLFDAREGLVRDTALGGLALGGVMHYIMLDVRNLSLWFQGLAPFNGGTGNQSRTVNGFTVYFSDRRNNRNAANQETGDYGWEDIINPAAANGAPNNILDVGEDVDASGLLETYGQNPQNIPVGTLAPLTAAARPSTLVTAAQAQNNKAILFRRALKLVNGGLGNIVAPGLSIVAENPVYVQGDWNATQAGFVEPNVATSIIADGVTVLSNNWNDNNSLTSPYNPGARPRSAQSYYRFATIGGKNPAFPRPTGWANPTDFGTDGGAHNFLRMLESGGTVNYRGSIATFFYSRQAMGVYKCCATVYGAPTRNFNFDTDFLDPTLLPPLTPVFRDLNTLGFAQELRPGK
jgi:Tfp pilus assembly protein PilX